MPTGWMANSFSHPVVVSRKPFPSKGWQQSLAFCFACDVLLCARLTSMRFPGCLCVAPVSGSGKPAPENDGKWSRPYREMADDREAPFSATAVLSDDGGKNMASDGLRPGDWKVGGLPQSPANDGRLDKNGLSEKEIDRPAQQGTQTLKRPLCANNKCSPPVNRKVNAETSQGSFVVSCLSSNFSYVTDASRLRIRLTCSWTLQTTDMRRARSSHNKRLAR